MLSRYAFGDANARGPLAPGNSSGRGLGDVRGGEGVALVWFHGVDGGEVPAFLTGRVILSLFAFGDANGRAGRWPLVILRTEGWGICEVEVRGSAGCLWRGGFRD